MGRDGPFSRHEFRVNNQWFGPSPVEPGQHLGVYAGTNAQGRGAVRLYTAPTNQRPIFVGEYLPPSAASELTLTSASGNRLLLSAPDGSTYTFDVVAKVFV